MIFSALKKNEERNRPLGTVVVPPSAWASDWEERPTEDVCIGLRLLSESDVQVARGEAAKVAVLFHPEGGDEDQRVEAYNDALMRVAVGRGCCDANNAYEPWFALGEDGARQALTSAGTRLIFDALERVALERSPVHPSATDEDIEGLAALAASAMAHLDPARQARVRRLLGFCMTEFLAALLDAEAPEGASRQ